LLLKIGQGETLLGMEGNTFDRLQVGLVKTLP
jgi:hypothetical protein